ncbi:MAG TPA: haloacid dehalogenase type II [Geminicoccaceae bacterium]|nr:haloacid dehalogenase type II [Geminicoccaceae bacterium]
MRLTDFDVLTFDCYGTLIDWESGIHAALRPLLARVGRPVPRDEALETFARHETEQEARTPAMPYSELLAVVHARLARDWGVAPDAEEDRRFGASVPEWPAFADSASSLQYLERHYKLVILSNVDRASFRGSNAKLGVTFESVYTAQDVGSYKPDLRNFAYVLARLGEKGVAPDRILHTAQSLFHDHAPAKAAGLACAWIDRRHGTQGWGATPPPPAEVQVDFHFPSLAAMVQAHQEALRGGA